MTMRVTRADRAAELMGEDIIGIFLSRVPLLDSNKTTEDNEPKLRRFVHDQESFQNPRLLGCGEHGVVVLVVVKGVQYAVKVYKDWKQPGPVFYPYELAIYTSPLAIESRASAQLDSLNENGTWAAKCHGWMKLSDAQFRVIGDVVNLRGLSRWAIVKEYLPTLTNPSHIPTIFTNFKIPKEARILPQDLRAENYRGTKIVDLSSALTAPCPEWSEFLFDYFYKQTIYGVFDWFKGDPDYLGQHHDGLFPGPLPLCFNPGVLEIEPGSGSALAVPGSGCT